METKDRFKKQISSTGRITWYFQRTGQQDVALSQNVRHNSLILKWRNNKGLRKKIVASNESLVL